MNFKVIGDIHEREAVILLELAERITAMSNRCQKIAKHYSEQNKIVLTRNQHKVLSYLYSVYYLDNQSGNERTWTSTREISMSLNGENSRGDWSKNTCNKLLNLNFIFRNKEGKWYITKYGIFYIHCETQDQDWDKKLICNASTGALEKDLKKIVGQFIQEKILENNIIFDEKGKEK